MLAKVGYILIERKEGNQRLQTRTVEAVRRCCAQRDTESAE
jgi:hypothetical protein